MSAIAYAGGGGYGLLGNLTVDEEVNTMSEWTDLQLAADHGSAGAAFELGLAHEMDCFWNVETTTWV